MTAALFALCPKEQKHNRMYQRETNPLRQVPLRLCSCLQLCFLCLGIGIEINSFQLQPLAVPRRRLPFPCLQSNVGLPIIHNPQKSFATRSTFMYGSLSDQRPDYDRRVSSLFNAASRINEAANESESILKTERFYNGTSSHEDIEDDENKTKTKLGNEVNEPICRVVATSDGKISSTSASSSLSPSSKSLLEKIELLYTVQSQKALRDLAYVLPRSAKSNNYHNERSRDDAMENEEGRGYGVPTAVSDAAQEQKLVSILKQSLEDGGFKLMDQRDFDLCSALNAGYLLRLSLLPDNKNLDPCIGKEFYPELYREEDENEGNNGRRNTKKDRQGNILSNDELLFDGKVLIFRRGYSKEISTGRLLLPKLDYLQASLVQRSSTAITRRVGAIEQRVDDFVFSIVSKVNNAMDRVYLQILQQFRGWVTSIAENFGLSENESVTGIITKGLDTMQSNNASGMEGTMQNQTLRSPPDNFRGKNIFKLSRYRTPISSFLPDAFDLNDALNPFLLCELGGDNAASSTEKDMYDGIQIGNMTCQYDDTLFSDPGAGGKVGPPSEPSYKPVAVRLLERVSIQNTVDFFSKKGRRELVKNYFRSSTLVEPSYEEVIVLSRPLRPKKPKTIAFPPKWLYEVAKVFDMEDRLPEPKNKTRDADAIDDGPMPLEIKAFYDVPMANVEAVLPKTKLVFRPADAIVFDLVSVVSFLAIAGSLKFDSPRLDLIAAVSLIFFAIRTFFRYSNKYARYDLLVNKFLTSKLAHRGPGALKYIVSEGNTNKALRAILVRDWLQLWLQKWDITQTITDAQLDAMLEQGKAYVNKMSSSDASQIDVDIISAMDDLDNLKMIDRFKVKEDQEAQESIKQLWSDTFE